MAPGELKAVPVRQCCLHPGAAELQPEQELCSVATVTLPNKGFLNPPLGDDFGILEQPLS